jgi:hypothetical protein
MGRSLAFVIAGAFALAGALLFPSTSQAQRMIWGQDASRASQPGVYIPYGGASVAERFGNPDPELFLWGDYGRAFWTTYAIDRQERFEMFGTRYTLDHPPLFNRILQRHR